MARSKPTQSHAESEPAFRATRGELIVVLLIVLGGAALRFAYPSRLAVEHFDEGVYASNIWFGEASDYRYPARHLYAPPLLPSLVEWSIILFGAGPISVKLVSLLAGTATIAVVWWVARRWFGSEAGIAAATLVALSDVHILYSRMALTDVLMCLWLLIAVGCVHEMLARGRQGWAVAAGLATGLAWATKYNGWLPVAIAVSGFVFYALVARWKSKDSTIGWRAFAISMLLMTITAAVVWSPAWFDLQDRGGYAAVAANHRGYLVGPEGWLGSFKRQMGNHLYLEGAMSCLSLGMALAAAVTINVARGSSTWNANGNGEASLRGAATDSASRPRWMLVVGFGLLLIATSAYLGVSVILGSLTVVEVSRQLTRRSDKRDATLAVCLLAVWFIGMLLSTPLYSPYPRLTLPWLMAAWLGSGAMIGRLVEASTAPKTNDTPPHKEHRRDWLSISMLTGGVFAVVAGTLFLWPRMAFHNYSIWPPQAGFKTIAESVVDDVTTRLDNDGEKQAALLQVYGEPGLFFQLAAEIRHRDGQSVVTPLGSLTLSADSPALPSFLITGPNAHRAPAYDRDVRKLRDRLELVAEYVYVPSDIVLLNWYPPRRSARPAHRVRLYQVR